MSSIACINTAKVWVVRNKRGLGAQISIASLQLQSACSHTRLSRLFSKELQWRYNLFTFRRHFPFVANLYTLINTCVCREDDTLSQQKLITFVTSRIAYLKTTIADNFAETISTAALSGTLCGYDSSIANYFDRRNEIKGSYKRSRSLVLT